MVAHDDHVLLQVEADTSMTLKNRNITVNSSTFQGNKDDVAVLLVSLHKQQESVKCN